MIRKFEYFVNEAEKKKKWYSGEKDYEETNHRNTSYYREDEDYDGDDDEDYDGGDDDFDEDAFDDEFDPEPYVGGGYGGYGQPQPQYPKDHDYKVGEVIEYLGNTGGRRGQKATVHRLREDGKVVVRFEDRKLIAISKNRMRPEGWKPPEPPPPPPRAELPALKPGQNWWEKNKKEEGDKK